MSNSNIVGAVIVAAIASFVMAFSFVGILGNTDGIIPIGDEAVFITGEACVVNVGDERELEDILSDLNRCADIAQGIE